MGSSRLYGQADLAAHYYHVSQHKVCRPEDPQPDWHAPPPPWMVRLLGPDAGRLKLHLVAVGASRCDWLVGGTPSQVPDRYARLSPVHRVHPGCPPTLLLHGQHDEMAPVTAMRQLHRRLEQAGVPVTAVYLPQTDHAFDLLGTAWSPQARTAIHVLERFLAVLAATDRRSAAQPISGSLPSAWRRRKHARWDVKGDGTMTTTRSAQELAAPPWARWTGEAWSSPEAPRT